MTKDENSGLGLGRDYIKIVVIVTVDVATCSVAVVDAVTSAVVMVDVDFVVAVNVDVNPNPLAILAKNLPESAKTPCSNTTTQLWSVVAERSSLPDSSSGVSSRMWVRIPAVTLVSLSKTLNHNCFSPPRG